MGNIELSSNSHYFSRDFSTARSRFRDAVKERGGRLDVLQLESKGPSGEELTIDIGWFGAPNPKRALVHSSGLHGVEGFAGGMGHGAVKLRLGHIDTFASKWETPAAVRLAHG